MKVLSLFDGISCGRIALDRAGIPVTEYFASEIDRYAIKVSEANYPDILQLGDIKYLKGSLFPKIDLLMGGSPCQGFSFAGKQLNFNDSRSALFFEFVRLLKECKPTYFLLENVKMKKEYQDVISGLLGVEPIEINSALVSAQNRKRLYWTNIPGVTQPEDKGILLKDILEYDTTDKNKSYCIDANYHKGNPIQHALNKCQRQMVFRIGEINQGSQGDRIYSPEGKAPTLNASSGGTAGAGNFLVTGGAFRGRYLVDEKTNALTTVGKGTVVVFEKPHGFVKGGISERKKFATLRTATSVNYKLHDGLLWRKLTPVECERLQTVLDNYTAFVSNTQRYKMLGNGWTVDVIAHILKYLKKRYHYEEIRN